MGGIDFHAIRTPNPSSAINVVSESNVALAAVDLRNFWDQGLMTLRVLTANVVHMINTNCRRDFKGLIDYCRPTLYLIIRSMRRRT